MTIPVEASPAGTQVSEDLSRPGRGPSEHCRVHLVESAPGSDWDAVARNTPHAHLGTASQWFTIIRNAYGHQPLYFAAREDGGGHAPLVLPAFLVRRWPVRGVVTSMPFLDAGGPAGGSPALVNTALQRLILEARSHAATQVEFRSLSPLDLPVQPSLEKVTLIRSLPSDPELLWRELDAKVRNQIRKAERSGISIEIGGLDRLDDFYEVFAVNMRDLGSPVHSQRFFRQLLQLFDHAARVVIARKNGLPVGGLIAISHGDTRYVPWASTLRAYSALCPNMLLYWETLRRACLDGMARFDFGRSSRGSGTYRFKRQWGTADAQLFWYTVPLRGSQVTSRISLQSRKWALISRAWSHLPLSLSRVLGPAVRRYLTQ